MQIEPTGPTSFTRGLTARAAWIGPLSGFVCSALVTLIGRAVGFEYRRELAMAVCFVVMVFVTGYYTGKLRTQPASVIGLAVVSGAVGALIASWY